MSTPLAMFGPGILVATRTDVTPGVAINIGYAQEFSLEASGSVKELFGQNQIALAVARGTIKLTGKYKAAVVSGIAMNAVFWGGSFSTSNLVGWNIDSTYTASTSSSAVQVGSSLTFEVDLGVKYAASGLPLQRVSTGSEATGKYSVSGGGQFGGTQTGFYNFAGTDGGTGGTTGGTALKITYTATSTAGQSLLFTNQLIGTTPTFQLDYYTNFDQPASKPFAFRLYSAVAAKMAWGFKLEDFNIPEFDFNVFANNAGQVFNAVFPEVS
jgi:hypothetical protein